MIDWVTDFLADEFLSTTALFTPAGGSSTQIRACFALGVEDVALGGDIVPQGIIGQAGCKSSDIAGVKNGDTLEVGGVSYRILKIEPDETGWTTLLLGKRYQ